MPRLLLSLLLAFVALDLSSSLPFRAKRQADDGAQEPMPVIVKPRLAKMFIIIT